jgi:hypothetical protein
VHKWGEHIVRHNKLFQCTTHWQFLALARNTCHSVAKNRSVCGQDPKRGNICIIQWDVATAEGFTAIPRQSSRLSTPPLGSSSNGFRPQVYCVVILRSQEIVHRCLAPGLPPSASCWKTRRCFVILFPRPKFYGSAQRPIRVCWLQ